MMTMYNLTPMTGKEASGERTWVMFSMELHRRAVMIVGIALLPTLLLTISLYPLLGQYVIFVVPLIPSAALFLFYFRSSQGLKLRPYQQFSNRRKAQLDTLLFCGSSMDMLAPEIMRLVPAHVPVVRAGVSTEGATSATRSVKPSFEDVFVA